MEIVEIKNLKKLLFGARIIGYGTTCICFLLRDKTVFKFYLNTTRKINLFDSRDMIEHLNLLSGIGNKTYITPDKLYMIDNVIIGYSMDYVKAKTLVRIDNNLRVSDILEKSKILYEDTYEINKNKFFLQDIHRKNILFNTSFNVVDLDHGRLSLNNNEEELLKWNMSKLSLTIIGAMFGENIFDSKNSLEMRFYDAEIKELYYKTLYENFENIDELFLNINERINNNDLKIKDLKRARRKLCKIEGSYNYR